MKNYKASAIPLALILASSVGLNYSAKAQTEQLTPSYPSWSENEFICPTPILNCSDYLVQRAISSSLLIANLEEKITNTGEQINYLEEKIRYYQSRNWTNFITLEPVKLIQNLFGGGDIQRNQLTITDIEIKIDALKANKNSLENQLIVEKDKLTNEIAFALLNIEESRERIKLINQKKKKVNLQSQVFLIKYSNGEGTTNQYLNYQENIDKLDFDLLQATNDYRQNLSKLLLLTN